MNNLVCEGCLLPEDGLQVRNITSRPNGQALCADCAITEDMHIAYYTKAQAKIDVGSSTLWKDSRPPPQLKSGDRSRTVT